MTRSSRSLLWIVGIFLCGIGALLFFTFGSAYLGRGGAKRHVQAIIRRPGAAIRVAAAKNTVHRGMANIAPLATVTASSVEESDLSNAQGVADGVPDANEWVSQGETVGAWLKLTWEAPVVISEIELCDRPSLTDNVTSGTLTFDDGSAIRVDALPPNGSPWHAGFPPKHVRWMVFRIDSAQGRNAGLAEILVYGTAGH